MNEQIILDLGTMQILKEKLVDVDYIVIQIGDKTYSTSYSEIKTGKDISIAKDQLINTIGIGQQDNLWIKGKFTESKNHIKLPEPLSFQINIYRKIENQ
jgi:hypothetical protein